MVTQITAPIAFAHRHLTPHLLKFLGKHPEVKVEVGANDRITDLIEEGLDLAIRNTQLKDSTLIARRLASNHRSIMATSSYLKTWGISNNPSDLMNHDLITWPVGTFINDWHFVINNDENHKSSVTNYDEQS